MAVSAKSPVVFRSDVFLSVYADYPLVLGLNKGEYRGLMAPQAPMALTPSLLNLLLDLHTIAPLKPSRAEGNQEYKVITEDKSPFRPEQRFFPKQQLTIFFVYGA